MLNPPLESHKHAPRPPFALPLPAPATQGSFLKSLYAVHFSQLKSRKKQALLRSIWHLVQPSQKKAHKNARAALVVQFGKFPIEKKMAICYNERKNTREVRAMIKNVVFDFGQVMIHYEPKYMVGKYVTDESDAALLETVVFDRLYWDKLDSGTITDREVVENSCARLPERLHAVAETIYYNWIYNIPEIDGMRDLVQDIKESFGVRVFLLSNISKYFAEHADEIPVLKEFEACIFSAVCGYVKPDRAIFQHLCHECNIQPNETVFIDDNENNIKGAQAFGIQGYLFDGNAEKLRKYLYGILQ